jgi:hemerythrin
MIATKFSGYHAHKLEHDKFVLTVVELVQKFNETQKVNLLGFTRFLKDWLLSHIAATDKNYFEYFKRIATVKADGRRTIAKEDLPG